MRAGGEERPAHGAAAQGRSLYVNPAGVLRGDAHGPDGSAPGADPAYTTRHHLDTHGISRAVLIGGEVLGLVAMPDPDVAATIAAA
ncbi:MAG TPA: hypothetical protein VFG72_06480, partial [Marmoricola sp.]|nr:hypothetical protein [Marmoricola sp.]